ncbi:MAG: hypothetical protein ACFFD6_00365, partial [Candidatus Thorarchaeota archaeon]
MPRPVTGMAIAGTSNQFGGRTRTLTCSFTGRRRVVSEVCHGHISICRNAVIGINYRTESGPGGNSSKVEWWSL